MLATKRAITELHGLPAAPGLALARAAWLRPEHLTAERRALSDIGEEMLRLNEARRAARVELETLQNHVTATVSAAEGAIFEAHIAFLDDPVLFDEVEAQSRAESCNIEAALAAVIGSYQELLRASDDPIFQARADDLEDLLQRLLRRLSGGGAEALALPDEPCIILADDLLPSVAVQLDRARVMGFCLATGGVTSHVAILARGLGLPAVVGVGPDLSLVPEGALLAVDGAAASVLVDPPAEHAAAFAERLTAERARREVERRAALLPAATSDGVAISVLANISSLAEAEAAVSYGAEGVGLLRTELLFIDRLVAPSEDEQLRLYRAIAAALGGRPLTIRTLDIGGDKPVAYLKQPPEQNPALGVRGIRLARSEPGLLRGQVRAILRIGPGFPIKLMFPMVSSLEEIHWLHGLVAEVRAELDDAGIPAVDKLSIGVMVEVPALAVIADQAARLVDFMSIGTNDLTQYTIAVDRTNSAVSVLSDALHPAVLRLIANTARAARAAGKEISVCGELAGDPLGGPLLVGLGIERLSMSPPLIPSSKAVLRQRSSADLRALALRVLDLETTQAVREALATA
jgi:phosphoenolpyruvate-protein phosphotransferase